MSKAELEARRAHLRVLKKLRSPLLIATPIIVLVGVAALVFRDGAVVGALVGATWASYVWGVATVVQRLAGSGPRLMGPIAEGWTADELRALHRAGWIVHNSVLLEGEDVDHVALGPAGVFAIETKWSASKWATGHFSLSSAARQARRNAAAVGRRVLGGQHGGQVRPVLVVWGERDPALTAVEDVPVVHGLELGPWLLAQTPDSTLQIAAAADRLDRYTKMRTEHEAQRQKLTRYEAVGVLGLIGDLTQAAAAALATLLVGAFAVVFAGLVGLAAPLPLGVAGIAARRVQRLRAISYGVLAGAVVLAALSILSALIYAVR